MHTQNNNRDEHFNQLQERIRRHYLYNYKTIMMMVGSFGLVGVYAFVYVVFGLDHHRAVSLSDEMYSSTASISGHTENKNIMLNNPISCLDLNNNATLNHESLFYSHDVMCNSELQSNEQCIPNLLTLCHLLQESYCNSFGIGGGSGFKVPKHFQNDHGVSIDTTMYASCGSFSEIEDLMFVLGLGIITFFAGACIYAIMRSCRQSESGDQLYRDYAQLLRDQQARSVTEALGTTENAESENNEEGASNYGTINGV